MLRLIEIYGIIYLPSITTKRLLFSMQLRCRQRFNDKA